MLSKPVSQLLDGVCLLMVCHEAVMNGNVVICIAERLVYISMKCHFRAMLK